MNIIFTLCSNNYLAQAKVFTDSAALFSPGSKIIIGLIDELHSAVDYTYFAPAEIIPLNELQLDDADELYAKYNIVELNTAIKPSYIKYLINRFPTLKKVLFFDPDIKIFHSLNGILNELDTSDILLTPHIHTPIDSDGYQPTENVFLNYGLYNLGFLGLNISKKNVNLFLEWWQARILYNGFANVAQGFFVDQLPVNLVPIFFEKVKLLKLYGYNMAPWNLHERILYKNATGEYILNDGSYLYFYHFSSYDYKKPWLLCKPFYTRYNFDNRRDLVDIYNAYHDNVLSNRAFFFETIACSLVKKETSVFKAPVKLRNKLSFWLRQLIPPIFGKIKDKILIKSFDS